MDKLYGKYVVAKADGTPVDPEAQYLVLRLDTDGCARAAAIFYAACIREEQPGFAFELSRLAKSLGVKSTKLEKTE
ncbi:unnamed protein product [marine sediment metagenome]|uniref:Uncharacterized protein n=1 Tax=marine sediment metagenome TaxID=412755 RepID=X1S219_9ZZZZ